MRLQLPGVRLLTICSVMADVRAGRRPLALTHFMDLMEPRSPSHTGSLCSSSSPPRPSSPSPPSPSSPSSSAPICRICHTTSSAASPLSSPCCCSGSIEFVHESCLLQWLSQRPSSRCELCHYQFRFSPVYAEGAPTAPSVWDGLLWAAKTLARWTPTALRTLLCGCVWLTGVPLVTWYAFVSCVALAASFQLPFASVGGSSSASSSSSSSFSPSVSSLYLLSSPRPPLLSSSSLLSLWFESQWGFLVCVGIVIVSLSLIGIRAVVRGVRDEQEQQRNVQLNMQPEPEIAREEQQQEQRREQPPPRRQQEDDRREERKQAADGRGSADAALQPEAERKDRADELKTAEEKSAGDDRSLATAQQPQPTDRVPPVPPPHSEAAVLVQDGAAVAAVAVPAEHHPVQHEAEEAEAAHPPIVELPPAAPPAAAAGDDWQLADVEDIPVTHWLGLAGPLHLFVLVVVSVLVYNTVFLACSVCLPIAIGRVVAWLLSLMQQQQQTTTLTLAAASHVSISAAPASALAAFIRYMSTLAASSSSPSFQPSHTDVFALMSLGYGGALSSTFLFLLFSSSSPLFSLLGLSASYYLLLLKLSALIVLKLVLYPALNGCLLHLAALPVLPYSLPARLRFCIAHPFTALLLHWALGMGMTLCLSFIISMLKRVVRRPVLRSTIGRFLRYAAVDDGRELQPFTDMLSVGLPEHAVRLVKHALFFWTLILLCVAVPIRMVERAGGVFPLRMRMAERGGGGEGGGGGGAGGGGFRSSDVGDVPFDMLLFHFAVPLLFERLDICFVVISACTHWLQFLCRQLGLSDYILLPEARLQQQQGEGQQRGEVQPQALPQLQPVAAVAMIEGAAAPPAPAEEREAGNAAERPAAQPVVAPAPPALPAATAAADSGDAPASASIRHFPLRMCLLCLSLWLTHLFLFFSLLILPLVTGRYLLARYYRHLSLYDVYCWAFAANVYVGCLVLVYYAARFLSRHLSLRRAFEQCKTGLLVVAKLVLVAVPLLVVVPLLTGLLIELLLVHPLRSLVSLPLQPAAAATASVFVSPLFSSPYLAPLSCAFLILRSTLFWHVWTWGIVTARSALRVVDIWPDLELKQRIDRVMRDGWRRLDVRFVYGQVVRPLLWQLTIHILVPLAVVSLLWPLHLLLLPQSLRPETLLLPYEARFRPAAAPALSNLTVANSSMAALNTSSFLYSRRRLRSRAVASGHGAVPSPLNSAAAAVSAHCAGCCCRHVVSARLSCPPCWPLCWSATASSCSRCCACCGGAAGCAPAA